jgi:prophage regulatory protein
MDPTKRVFRLFIVLIHVRNFGPLCQRYPIDPNGMWRHDVAQKILRRAEVEQATGLPRSTIYDAIAKGTFPRPIKLSERSVGWLELEIVAWQKARIAARDGVAERDTHKG